MFFLFRWWFFSFSYAVMKWFVIKSSLLSYWECPVRIRICHILHLSAMDTAYSFMEQCCLSTVCPISRKQYVQYRKNDLSEIWTSVVKNFKCLTTIWSLAYPASQPFYIWFLCQNCCSLHLTVLRFNRSSVIWEARMWTWPQIPL